MTEFEAEVASAWTEPVAGKIWRGLVVAILAGLPAVRAEATAAQSSSDNVVKLAPMTVFAPKDKSAQDASADAYWKFEQLGQGDNFHIRGGQLVDAIIFRHDYLQQHPEERAIVVVTTEPKYRRVTQAVAAYTVGHALRVVSHALGDISAGGLTAADIDHPEKIQRFIRQLRSAYLHSGGAGLPPLGVVMALSEESGNYAMAGQLYDGTSGAMLSAAYHWLGDQEKAGLIPLSRGKVKVDIPGIDSTGKALVKTEEQESIVFDWDGYHYLYNDEDGMLAKPLPKNPVTGLPCLVLKDGDIVESVYFVLTYSKQHPGELAALLPPLDGLHAAAAFTSAGQLFILSPFLGRFALPAHYRIDQVADLAKLHAGLVAQAQKKLEAKQLTRPRTSMPQEMPGDNEVEQIRRAYLALAEIGLPVKIVEGKTMLPGLELSYAGTKWTYQAPGFQDQGKTGASSVEGGAF